MKKREDIETHGYQGHVWETDIDWACIVYFSSLIIGSLGSTREEAIEKAGQVADDLDYTQWEELNK